MKYFIGSLIICLALSGTAFPQEKNVSIQQVVGPITLNIYSPTKEKLDAELKFFKEYCEQSQKDLSETLSKHQITLEIFVTAEPKPILNEGAVNSHTGNKVADIIEPYKSTDNEIHWKEICIDKENNLYIIQRCARKEKSGLNKSADSSKKISMRFECADSRREKALEQTFAQIADVLGNAIRPGN